jgi:hypothetical protein
MGILSPKTAVLCITLITKTDIILDILATLDLDTRLPKIVEEVIVLIEIGHCRLVCNDVL